MEQRLAQFIEWLSAQPFQQAIRYTEWVVPAAQTLHIICVAFLIVPALVLALRALEITGHHWTLRQWQERLVIPVRLALIGLLLTGIVQVVAEPARELTSWLFRAKLLLVIATFYGARRLSRALARGGPTPAGTRLLTLVVLLLWVVIAILGRWIAYAG